MSASSKGRSSEVSERSNIYIYIMYNYLRNRFGQRGFGDVFAGSK